MLLLLSVEGCRVSSAEYCVHLVSVWNVFLLCIVGKMGQDVGMV